MWMASRSLLLLRAALPVEQRLALQPGHGEQPVGRVRGHDLRHVHVGLVAQHVAIERDVPGLAAIVELLAQARRDLGMDLVGADGGIEALADREHQFQLVEVGFERRRHVGILQLGRDLGAVRAASRDGPGPARRRTRLPCRTWRTSTASPARARSPCGGARRPSPWPAHWPATGPARAHIPAAARRGWWQMSWAAFISGPFSPPSAAFRSEACLSRSRLQPR